MIKLAHSIVLAATCCVVIVSSNNAHADVILSFTGAPFSDIIGAPTFTTADRITGTITFDDVPAAGAMGLSARSFTLTTTVGGGPGFSFTVPDATTDPRVTRNEFDFAAGSLMPTGFFLAVEGEAFGDAGFPEELSIADIGDLAIIDSGAANESIGLNFARGTFTAVPEPSGLLLLAAASVPMLVRFRRRRRIRDQKKATAA